MGWPLAVVYRWFVLKRHGSLVPLIGGTAGATACFLLPADSLRHWWFHGGFRGWPTP